MLPAGYFFKAAALPTDYSYFTRMETNVPLDPKLFVVPKVGKS